MEQNTAKYEELKKEYLEENKKVTKYTNEFLETGNQAKQALARKHIKNMKYLLDLLEKYH